MICDNCSNNSNKLHKLTFRTGIIGGTQYFQRSSGEMVTQTDYNNVINRDFYVCSKCFLKPKLIGIFMFIFAFIGFYWFYLFIFNPKAIVPLLGGANIGSLFGAIVSLIAIIISPILFLLGIAFLFDNRQTLSNWQKRHKNIELFRKREKLFIQPQWPR